MSAILVETRTEAEKILQQLNEGFNFGEMARQHSIGPGKEEGGDIGYFAQGEMMEELDSTAVKLQVGQHSHIIETSRGY